MLSSELLIVAMSGCFAVVLYGMYRYFNDIIDTMYQELLEKNNILTGIIFDKFESELIVLKQQVKDSLQSNALCCKSAMESIKTENVRLSAWCAKLADLVAEKQLQNTEYKYPRKDNQKHGSIQVVIPELNKDKTHARRSTTKSK